MDNLAAIAGYAHSRNIVRTDDAAALGNAIARAVVYAIRDAELDANRHLRYVVLANGEPDHVYDAITNSSVYAADDPSAVTDY